MTTIADQLFASVLIEAAKKAAAGKGDDAALEALDAAQAMLYALEREARAGCCEQCGGPLNDGMQPCDACIFTGPMGLTEDQIRDEEKKR